MKFCFIAKIFLKMTSRWNFFKWGNFWFARFLRGLKLRQNQVWLMVVITNRFNNPYFYPTIQFAYHQITISQFLQFAPQNSFRASNKSQIMRRNFSRINKFYHSAVQRFNWIWANLDFDRHFKLRTWTQANPGTLDTDTDIKKPELGIFFDKEQNIHFNSTSFWNYASKSDSNFVCRHTEKIWVPTQLWCSKNMFISAQEIYGLKPVGPGPDQTNSESHPPQSQTNWENLRSVYP